jgi:aminoglycoside phosphotransferase family enzyme/predicted kinase
MPERIARPRAPARVELTLAQQADVVTQLAHQLGAAQAAGAVERIETHISFVLIAGAFAYKIKKAVNLGFLDFTTLARRRHFCEEELRLNRRLAPALYLGLVPVTLHEDRAELGGEGTIVDCAVKMLAFPQDGLWDSLVRHGGLQDRHIDQLADRLAAFHRDAAVCRDDTPFGEPARVRAPMVETLDALERLLGDAADLARLDNLRVWEAQAFRANEAAFGERRACGQVRECHGDLHLGNVAQVDGEATLFDCLEFDAGLRWTDVMSDVAFLAMDLHHHGRPELAHRFVNAYLERSGDYDGARVLRYHLVYRALVRAKVAALRAAQTPAPGGSTDGESGAAKLVGGGASNEARRLLELALVFSRPKPAVLLVTHGFSGSGKTTGSARLLEVIGAIRVRSDVERKRLAGLPGRARSGSALQSGLYSSDRTRATQARLRDAAKCVLEGGFNVILDATFLQREQRDLARDLARRLDVRFVILDFQANEDKLRERVLARQRSGADASEADLAVLDDQLANDQPLAADEQAEEFHVIAQPAPGVDAVDDAGARLCAWLDQPPWVRA